MTKQQLFKAIEEMGFKVECYKWWPKHQNLDCTISYQGAEYSFEADTKQQLLDLINYNLM